MESPVCQIAQSVSDLARSQAWYRHLGLEPSGTLGPIRDEAAARMLEVPAVDVSVGWIAGRDPMSQVELMCFSRPMSKSFPPDWTLRDFGYGISGLVVPDFERVVTQLEAEGAVHEVTHSPQGRSAWVTDPDGIPLELMETDPLGSVPSARGCESLASIRYVTLTVNEPLSAVQFWRDTLGLSVCQPDSFAFAPFPQCWSSGLECKGAVLKGGAFLLRLMAPLGGTRRSAQRRALCDLGPMNIAVILADAADFSHLLQRFVSDGHRLAGPEAMSLGTVAGTIFGRGDQDVSIEIGYVLPGHESSFGWKR